MLNGERLCISLWVFPFDSMCSLDPCIKILYLHVVVSGESRID